MRCNSSLKPSQATACLIYLAARGYGGESATHVVGGGKGRGLMHVFMSSGMGCQVSCIISWTPCRAFCLRTCMRRSLSGDQPLTFWNEWLLGNGENATWVPARAESG